MEQKTKDIQKRKMSAIKLKPILFMAMCYNFGYAFLAFVISINSLAFFVGMSGLYSLALGIAKLSAIKRYRQALAQKTNKDIRRIEKIAAQNIAICTSAIAFLFFSFIIVNRFFYYSDNPLIYNKPILAFVATTTVIAALFTVFQVIIMSKNNSLIITQIRLADLVMAFVGLALLLYSILSATQYPHREVANLLGGLFFSVSAFAICAWMFIRYLTK